MGLLAAAMLVGPLAPASDADPDSTVLSDVSTAVPGHVTGTVTTTAAYVRLVLTSGAGSVNDVVRSVPGDTHTLTFDVPTWGFPATATLGVLTCVTADAGSCTVDPVATQAISPTDVTPSVTFPDISHLGQENGPYTVTSSDPDGGGRLFVLVSGSPSLGLARNGTTDLNLQDGDRTLSVIRCAEASGGPCTSPYAGLSAHVVVYRMVYEAQVWFGLPELMGADDSPAADVDVPVYFPEITDLTVTLELRYDSTGWPLPGRSTTVVLRPDENHQATVPVDLTGVPSGVYHFGGSFTYEDPDFGHLQGIIRNSHPFEVDSVAPVFKSVKISRSLFYPARDGYRDDVELKSRVRDAHPTRTRFEIRDAAGDLVDVLRSHREDWGGRATQTWTGRNDDGQPLPSGRYVVTVVSTDEAGNSTTAQPLRVRISSKSLHDHVLKKTVTAKASFVDSNVGRCSKVSFPAIRGPKGSMGLYAGVNCHGNWKQTWVATSHGMRVPKALNYGKLRVWVRGGANTAEPRSLAYLQYYRPDTGWGEDMRLGPAWGRYIGHGVRGKDYISPTRYLYWGTFTARTARFDIHSFTVRMHYQTLS